MALPVIGTIYQAGKMAELEMKWQQRKDNGGKAIQQQDPQIKQFYEDMERMREGRRLGEITTKMKSGATPTSEELEYLRRNNPEMYREAMDVIREREAYERQLKECKSKEDVEKLKVTKMGSFLAEARTVMNNPNIPEGEKVKLMEKLLKRTMNVESGHMEFINSAAYKNLPEETDDKNKAVNPAEPEWKEDTNALPETGRMPDDAKAEETPASANLYLELTSAIGKISESS